MSFACRPPNNGGGSPLNLLFDTDVSDLKLSPADATATLQFNSDGSTSVTGNGSGGTAPKTWFTGTPSGWSIRRTVNTGALQIDAGAGWLALSSARTFGCQETGSFGVRNANVTFEFSNDGGTSVQDERTTAFTAEVEP